MAEILNLSQSHNLSSSSSELGRSRRREGLVVVPTNTLLLPHNFFPYHLLQQYNLTHDRHNHFQFIDDQLIIDQTARRRLPSSSSSSSSSSGSRTRTRGVDRLRMSSHERVVFVPETNGEQVLLGSCCICLEEFTAGTELLRFGCQHVYHQNCIVPWLDNHNSCPLCRRPL